VNHLGHALPFLDDDPHKVAGALLPDWLRVVDKRARLHPDVLARAPTHTDAARALKEGAERHHQDDHRFHADASFDALAGEVGAEIRARHPGLRGSAIAHILVEMWVDRVLIEDDPARLARLYEALHTVDPVVVAGFARQATGRPLAGAEALIVRFTDSAYLYRYQSDEGLFACLQGLWGRVTGAALPAALLEVVTALGPKVEPLVGRHFARPAGLRR
jgi:hypothetical protein